MPNLASVEIDTPANKGETKIRRSYRAPDRLLERPAEGINTMADVFLKARERFPKRAIMGWRDVVRTHDENKEITKKVEGKEVKQTKTWQYYELSNYKYLTYDEFEERIQHASNGLVNLGLSKDTRFNIYATTAINWQNMAHACFRQSIPFCTAYETLGEEGLQHSLIEPQVVGVFTNAELLPTLANVIRKADTVKYVIYDGKPEDKHLDTIRKVLDERQGKLLTIEHLWAEGKANPAESHLPTRDNVACIMYTSGSTGAPKGVILTHGNLVASIAAVELHVGDLLSPTDTFLAYLPLAHILEFIVECTMTYMGITMGYGKVKTLTQASVRNCDGDIKAFKPSIMIGVPAVWELIRKGILSKVNAGGSFKQKLFNGALAIKKNKIPFLTSVVDNVVFKAVREQTGGRLRIALCGGAALSRETQEFLNNALVLLLQGYGLTESCGMTAILHPEFYSYGPSGGCVPAIEIKLCDVPDAGYFATNNPPQGEVLIRGPSVTKGYFNRDDVNKESFQDGWFLTGDVGQWNPDGTLSIIDRKKNLVKLSGGEYIAIERLESVYKSSNLVSNICVHAHSDAKQPMAIIFPREDNLVAAAQKIGASGDLEELCKNRDVAKMVMDDVNVVGKKAGFKNLEMLQTVLLVHEELAMTAAQKLSRKDIVNKYEGEIKKLYM
ncbi:related to long-chain-fatty-acid-CoA ligase [Ustilago bromivora]|uniref:Related to long-chain-fatty-acid-CoA ligase n=1 Tax=Ustilago bromivora TaxID=307758 RepID=A0A1K0G9H0_9BASI|nr:related to long-chain-fatty-acid-CoA ligase [Ustilago bromivora]SYW75954.1 related to long-chain-fatty-acid-CoA ligase [Ustilago bromivora]